MAVSEVHVDRAVLEDDQKLVAVLALCQGLKPPDVGDSLLLPRS